MLDADVPRASFVDTPITTGLPFLKWAFTAIVTLVSVIPAESFESVLPVHGATAKISSIFLGPIGSASLMLFMDFRLQISSISLTKSEDLQNLVSVLYAYSENIGYMS